MAEASNTLRKAERLKSRKAIEYLFRHGKSHTVPPFRLIYLESVDLQSPAVMTVSVPKRLLKSAVDRNLIKRRSREAYRLRKNGLYDILNGKNKHYKIIFVYQAQGILDFQTIDKSMGILLKFLTDRS